MERRGSNSWLVAVLAVAVGFLAALLIFGGNDNKTADATVSSTVATTATDTTATQTTATTATTTPTATTTATATTQSATPQDPQVSLGTCVNLWNQTNNRGDQVFLVNIMSQQPVRVHVGITSDVPARCLITVTTNSGSAYVFPEGGGTSYPYAQAPGKSDASTLPAAQKISNALEQSDGTLKAR